LKFLLLSLVPASAWRQWGCSGLAVKEKYSFPAALQAQLDEQHAPTKAQGLPWS